MDHAEQQLIGNLAERIRAAQPVAEDPQATAAVQRLIGSQPDALYVAMPSAETTPTAPPP